MRKLSLALTAILSCCVGASAWALPLFDYTDSVSVASAPTLPSNPPGFGSSVFGIGGSTSITFNTISVPITGLDAAAPGAVINLGSVTYNSVGSTDANPLPFALNFNYAVTLKDAASGNVGTFNLTGQLFGTFVGVSHTIADDYTNLALSQPSIVIGSNTYYLSLAASSAPASGIGQDGALHIRVSDAPGNNLPEPGSLGLLGIGAAGLLGRRRKTA